MIDNSIHYYDKRKIFAIYCVLHKAYYFYQQIYGNFVSHYCDTFFCYTTLTSYLLVAIYLFSVVFLASLNEEWPVKH